jgi:hypothetical protein
MTSMPMSRLGDADEGVEIGAVAVEVTPFAWTSRAISRICSKIPSVFGTVSISAATSSVMASSSTQRSSVLRALTSALTL